MKTQTNNNNITRQSSLSLLAVLAITFGGSVHGFASPRGIASSPSSRSPTNAAARLFSTTPSEVLYEPVFDFSDASKDAVSSFDRIDDAIMGGISTSSIRAVSSSSSEDDGESYASWSGVCRIDGGGFCGTRTLPFKDGVPLKVAGEGVNTNASADGFYLTVRLTSDNEPERRVWKLTTRVENVSRSEQLYQAMFEVPKQDETNGESSSSSNEWKTIRVPFESFQQVRGPRIVENGPPLDISGGLFQIGMVMSKFQIATNMTEFENFRPGYFELQIKEIGVYTSDVSSSSSSSSSSATSIPKLTSIETPKTLTKQEADQNKPVALKIIFPIVKLFFNEKRSRQKSATKILKKRGMGRLAIAKFSFQRKAASRGIIVALAQTLVGSVSTAMRLVAFWTLKIALFYPFVTIRRAMKKLKGNKKNTTNQPPQAA